MSHNYVLEHTPSLKKVIEGNKSTELLGLSPEVRLFLSVSAVKSCNRTVLYITDTPDEAKRIYNRALRFLDRSELGYYPVRDLIPCESVAVNESLDAERVHCLNGLTSGNAFLVVIPRYVLGRRLIPPESWKQSFLSLKKGDFIEIKELCSKLALMGYRRDVLTEEPGMFSVRGSIVDIFPHGEEYPCRIDFFDTEIESIRSFDSSTQISLAEKSEVAVTAGSSFFLPINGREQGIMLFKEEGERRASGLKAPQKDDYLERIKRYLEYIEDGSLPDVLEQLLPYFYGEAYIEDYLPDNALIILDEPGKIRKSLEKDDEEVKNILDEMYISGEIFPCYPRMFRDCLQIISSLNNCLHDKFTMLSFAFLQSPHGFDVKVYNNLSLREFSFYLPVEQRSEEIASLARKGKVYLCANDENSYKRFKGLAESLALIDCIPVMQTLEVSLESCEDNSVFIVPSGIGATAGETESSPKHKKHKKSRTIDSFVDLKPGDYVVHDAHGIGEFLGMERLTIDDIQRDYLKIRYKGTDKLYVPTDQMDLLQKYIGNGESAPKINSLGGKDWYHAKEKARASVKEMAEDLLKLYAEREKTAGHAFSPDSSWQWDMENQFPFEETPDQIDAISDVKSDMEKSRPMDRLLCGDVGYGKTEVALRAAFKAVMDHKQVAVLVPTTILAQQHERTFRQRLEAFGVSVGVLSRFRTKKQNEETIKALITGAVDVVIGTHMLFNKEVVFNDLGLLIIDEEQRFGVAHKEKIKQLKKNIDVLAMSATPIPRTLHMSLAGVRDISIIETPPKYRRSVKTYVMEYRKRLIQEGIERELARGGQVYYVHNRIEDMPRIERELREMFPDREILVGHGRMSESALEKLMLSFMERKGDILLCTTIVESGLDIPNVNTLIVDDAHKYGLSQMYQLRGRVGRSRRQAFAYFFYPAGKLLNEVAQKRLAAVRDYTDLGSGFKIAMRDMEIRGAGNILGAEQHGHMLSVGFDMYCRLIEEEMNRLNGIEKPEIKADVSIDVLCSAYLPDDYIGDKEIKLNLYKRISALKDGDEIRDCLNEMEDRFGSVPDSVYQLFLVIRLKLLCEELGILSATQNKKGFKLLFREVKPFDGKDLEPVFAEYGRHFSFAMEKESLVMNVSTGKLDVVKSLIYTIRVLAALSKKGDVVS